MDVETRSVAAAMCLILTLNIGEVIAQEVEAEIVQNVDHGAASDAGKASE